MLHLYIIFNKVLNHIYKWRTLIKVLFLFSLNISWHFKSQQLWPRSGLRLWELPLQPRHHENWGHLHCGCHLWGGSGHYCTCRHYLLLCASARDDQEMAGAATQRWRPEYRCDVPQRQHALRPSQQPALAVWHLQTAICLHQKISRVFSSVVQTAHWWWGKCFWWYVCFFVLHIHI